MNEIEIKFVEKHRAQGLSWSQVADLYKEEYGVKITRDALRLKYNYHAAHDVVDPVDTLKKQRMSQVSASAARTNLRKSLDAQISLDAVLKELKSSVKGMGKAKLPKPIKQAKKGTKMTIEALLGDIQVGKIMEDYNSEICQKRLQEYTRALVFKVKQHIKDGYIVEKIILSMLGDMIECSEKHHNSARATDCSTPEQMRLITEFLYQDLLLPLAALGIPIEVKCVTGNHENPLGGLNMFYPGREHLSWTFYNYLQLICKEVGLKNIKFDIATGAFLTYDIYGHTVLIEHGVGVAANEASMSKKLQRRINQVKKHISFFRMGDKHHVARFNNDQYVINGAFFGSDEKGVEFSGICGYHAPAAQVIFCYVPREKGDVRTPMYDSFVIQLQHVR